MWVESLAVQGTRATAACANVCSQMTASPPEFESRSGPRLGRLILLFAAYAPVAVIVGVRGVPSTLAWAGVALGMLGVATWVWFLWWLPRRQVRESTVEGAQFIDSEVTGYIVSLLLPVVAASRPGLNDWLAYVICGALILAVAFFAELWSVNPVTYAFRMRAARAKVDGVPQVILVRGPLGDDGARGVTHRLGVTYLLPPSAGDGEGPSTRNRSAR